ncbi:MAG: hypothetical protein AB7I42_29675 [Bradyrhizobium sp.]|uniref:hypothetical protein n=1 Tax=Bradyrhizobium sp. TaxID=376 RepID=UPI003D0C29AA
MAMIIGTVDQAVAAGRRRRFDEGQFRGIADYLFETAPGAEPGPQALIARQAPGWTLPVHFHMQHQFQVVLRGSGSLGKHALAAGSVHYTSPQSGYGPIVAGDDGLDYFTLRVLTDKGAWYLPENRNAMDRGLPKEQQWGNPQRGADPSGRQELLPLRSDGLGAWAYVATGSEVRCAEARSDAGRFHAVIRGEFRLHDVDLPAGSCVYTDRSEDEPTFIATSPDSLLVIVQFPHQALHNFVPPERRIAPSARGVQVQ